MLKLKCKKCGVDYEKPEDFEKWNKKHTNVFFRWSLDFCDTCRKLKENDALKHLPEIIESLSNTKPKICKNISTENCRIGNFDCKNCSKNSNKTK